MEQPISGPAYAKKTDPAFTLWQLPGQTRSQINSYVILTMGKELIVIDGGTKGDATYLRKFIHDRGNLVRAWLISHPHLDHVDALTEILNDPGDMKIEKIYGSFPNDAWIKKHQDAHADKTQLQIKAALKKSRLKLLDLSPGQKIKFKGVTFEIFSTLNPELTVNAVNNQSVVWRMHGGETSVLFLGDLGKEGGDNLLAGPFGNRLESEYVQMSHHGQTGVSEEFYKVVNPNYCLWPTPRWLWENNNGKGRNSGPWKTLEVRTWMEKLNIKKHYVAKDGLHKIEIPVNQPQQTTEQSPSGKGKYSS